MKITVQVTAIADIAPARTEAEAALAPGDELEIVVVAPPPSTPVRMPADLQAARPAR